MAVARVVWATALTAAALASEASRSGVPASGAFAAERPAPVLGAWLERLHWVNARPLGSRQLAGRVVIVEFWTFDCINCRRTVPAMKRLEEIYRGAADVALIGIHTPELEQEYPEQNVRRAIERLGIRFPVAQDNEYVAWKAFDNQYWPALYLIDRRGRVRELHSGELHLGTSAWDDLRGKIENLRKERI